MTQLLRTLVLFLAAGALVACDETSDPAAAGSTADPSPNGDAAESEWLIDYEKAVEESRERGRPILMNFTGSDWCPPCIRMKSDVLSEDAFMDYASENLVLLELDFPRRIPQEESVERQNRELAEKFGIQSFPTFVLVDAEGDEVRRTVGYVRGGPEAFVAWISE